METLSKLTIDRFAGCLMGLAVGDALGAPIEFMAPGTFEPLTDMIAGGKFKLERGQFTDDTSMALCLAESLYQKGQFNPQDQLKRYLRWYREGYMSSTGVCFDIGDTTKASLEDFERTGQPFRTQAGVRGSNGAIMRLAPVPMAFVRSPEKAIHYSADSARTTHNFTESVDSCRLLAALIIGALQGKTKKQILAPGYTPVKIGWEWDHLTPRVEELSQGSYKRKNPPEISAIGDSVNCLESALWAFYNSNSFAEGALMAVNLGDDADSTGSVFGQLAGAYYGLKSIPSHWFNYLWNSDLLFEVSKKLIDLAAQIS